MVKVYEAHVYYIDRFQKSKIVCTRNFKLFIRFETSYKHVLLRSIFMWCKQSNSFFSTRKLRVTKKNRVYSFGGLFKNKQKRKWFCFSQYVRHFPVVWTSSSPIACNYFVFTVHATQEVFFPFERIISIRTFNARKHLVPNYVFIDFVFGHFRPTEKHKGLARSNARSRGRFGPCLWIETPL